MKKQILLLSSILIFQQLEIFSQSELYIAPSVLPVKSDIKTLKSQKINSLPASYDMRKLGLVTSIKDQLSQGPCGSCWTHSCMANLESLNLKLDNKTYDLSEDNLNNCHSPFDYLPCKGGSFYMSSAYLLGGEGPLLESQDPYMGPKDNSCPTPGSLKPLQYITDAWFVPVNNRDLIKQTIMSYGSLDVSFYFTFNAIHTPDSTFFFNKAYTFSTPAGSVDTSGFGQWHEVSLIGWDDNKTTMASQKGAWIVKNSIVKSSFTDLTQSAGFLYISYYDSVAFQNVGCWPKKIAYDSTAQLHHYDESGYVSSFGYNDNNADYGLVKFVAGFDQQLKFLTSVAVHPNTTMSFDVYDTFDGTTLSGLLGSISNKTCTYAGYNSFDLATPITIKKGNDFYVKVTYNCPSDYTYLVPMEVVTPGYNSNAVIESGVCWVSSNGSNGSWSKLGANTASKYDLCIKAYATPLSATSVNEINSNLAYSIYPNPANKILNIDLSSNSAKTLTFRNIQGQVILIKQTNDTSTSIDISDLPVGIYFITVQSESSVQTVKFVRAKD